MSQFARGSFGSSGVVFDDVDSDGESQKGGKGRDGKDGDKGDKKGTINRVNRKLVALYIRGLAK